MYCPMMSRGGRQGSGLLPSLFCRMAVICVKIYTRNMLNNVNCYQMSWLRTLHPVWEVLGSNIRPYIGYPDHVFIYIYIYIFPSVSPGNCWDGTSVWAIIISYHIHSNSFSDHLTIQCYTDLLTASLSKP
jgi:hypothetical protein